MKRGTIDHPKTRELTRTLSVCRAHAVGILECLWHFTAQYAQDGNISKFSSEQIADACFWEKDADVLIAALKFKGVDFLDDDGLVHDWPIHCDDSVHMRLARSGQYFACGCSPKLTRLSQKEKESAEKSITYAVCARHAHVVRPALALALAKPYSPLPPTGGIEDKVDYKAIVDMFNAICTKLPKVSEITDKRKKQIKARAVSKNGDALNYFKEAFEIVNQSAFHTGNNERGWRATFDWLFKNDENMLGLIERFKSKPKAAYGMPDNGEF